MTGISKWLLSLLSKLFPQSMWGQYQSYAEAKRRWKEIVEETK